ncbi:MAG: HmuY family protein [Deltaproteobacteria bacterium]|nr:HmuY family protein [Deltaproteobacteria bacterium]MBW2254922.1 HmuY family protein [Deltaproteobacteria bacterium]
MRVLFLLPLALAVSCTGEPDPICTDPVEPPCVDEMILDLSLQEDVSGGAVTNTADGDGWITNIDASAGGYAQAANNPWVYVRFTDEGAQRVDIDDEAALESMEWHLAARRFILRLNGGTSGPSCVGGAAFLEATYESLTEVSEDQVFYTDDFYTADCTIINDSSGLPGSPQVVLAPWWSYAGCVATSDVPFLIQLDDARVLKLVVDAYYGSGQDDCNTSDVPGEQSARFMIRWAFLQ